MTNRRALGLLSGAHVVDDLYQGAVPAALPFFIADRGYSYAAASGLVLAGTAASSVAQPLFGRWTDRHDAHWLVGLGIVAAGGGVALAGYTTQYLLTCIAVAASGLGVAAFHPEAARVARAASGDSSRAMSVFAVGGNLGFATGPLVVTPVLLAFGLTGTAYLFIPALLMGLITLVAVPRLARRLPRMSGRSAAASGRDDWPAFARLTGAVTVRSMIFFGVASFLSLYWIDVLGSSVAQAATALTVFLAAGAVGTLLGGWLADRYGRLPTARGGFLVTPPVVVALLLAPTPLALVLVAVLGVAVLVPFTVLVTLGQDYLPARVGTASGLTLGIGIGVGGVAAPLLGFVADAYGVTSALAITALLPVAALACTAGLHDPRGRRRAPQPVVAGS